MRLTFDLLDQLHGVVMELLPEALVVGEVETGRWLQRTRFHVSSSSAHLGSWTVLCSLVNCGSSQLQSDLEGVHKAAVRDKSRELE